MAARWDKRQREKERLPREKKGDQEEKGRGKRQEGKEGSGGFSRGGELREGGAKGEGSENLFYPHFRSSGRVRTYCLFIYTSCFELFTPVFFLAVCGFLLLLEVCWCIASFGNVLNMDPLLFLFLSERSCSSFLLLFHPYPSH